MNNSEITIENKHLKLIIDNKCRATSLIFKPTDEECLFTARPLPLFSITEKRPFNNEIKLAYPNKRTTFNANRVRMENDTLIIGFELILFEAAVKVKITDDYISFKLEEFIIKPDDFGHLAMDVPPVEEFRLMQLPVKNTDGFGEWLNVCYIGNTAINLLAVSPYERIDAVKEKDYCILTADAVKNIKAEGCEAALIVSQKDELLNCIETIENDYNLPHGVKSRRSPEINSSIYWSLDVTADNLDKHISYIKKFGFTKFLIYFTSVFDGEPSYSGIGEYKINKNLGGSIEALKQILDKIKAEGITPGIHFLHTHIGFNSPYLKPEADHRLHLTRHFTLAMPLKKGDDKVYVEENPLGTVMHEKCRVLKFGGELIKYEGYTKTPPYYFYGCERGYNGTYVKEFDVGTIGGILDISEFGAKSVYIDQNSSLQDEVAEKIADAYNAGFEFVYFDGSEGTNPPYEFHVSNAQYKVYSKLKKEPLFCEGAAKTHFGWHMLSGANAFDIFPPEVFKEKIAEFPAAEIKEKITDFTRINFGWWDYNIKIQPDMYEYGSKIAAAWNCPTTVIANFDAFDNNPESEDIFEILHRWEDIRKQNLLTDEQRDMLKDTDKEHTLLINEADEYEIVEYEKIENAAKGNKNISAYVFDRREKTYVVYWGTSGSGSLLIDCNDFTIEDEIGKNSVNCKKEHDKSILPIGRKRYFSSMLTKEETVRLFESAVYLPD